MFSISYKEKLNSLVLNCKKCDKKRERKVTNPTCNIVLGHLARVEAAEITADYESTLIAVASVTMLLDEFSFGSAKIVEIR